MATHTALLMNATVKILMYFTAMITLAVSPLRMSVMGFRTALMGVMSACAVMLFNALLKITSTVSRGANTVLEGMACMHNALHWARLIVLGS